MEMGIPNASTTAAVVAAATGAPPLSARLRRIVATVASEATLTCAFQPGGRIRGAGIVSPNHCGRCNQPRWWHEVAAAIPDVELAEALRAAAIEGETSHDCDR